MTTLTLGDFTFARYEIPEQIGFGASQKMNVHTLVGGAKVIDVLGGIPVNPGWSGYFAGENALDRARYLEGLANAGKPLALTYAEFSYQVIIADFKCEFRSGPYLPYSIELEVITDNTAPVTIAPTPNIEQLVADDLASAQLQAVSINDAMLTGLIGSLATAILNVGDFGQASVSDIAALQSPIGLAQARTMALLLAGTDALGGVDGVAGVTGGGEPTALAATLSGQVSASIGAPALLALRSVLARMSGNIAANGSGTTTLTVGAGNLFQLAAEQYGDAMAWTTLAQANGITDPQLSGITTLIVPGPATTTDGVLTGVTAPYAPPTIIYTAPPTPIIAPVSPPSPPAFGALPTVIYDQGMGVTGSDGLVMQLPFQPSVGSGLARQVWANTAIGSTSFNGLSPYPGYRMNGTGANYQVGATGPGAADSTFGPVTTVYAAINAAPFGTSAYTGFGITPNQIFFAEGQTFSMVGPSTFGWGFYGNGNSSTGATAPFCIQSYDPADPLNMAKHGHAGMPGRGARPIWAADVSQTNIPWPSTHHGGAYDSGGWAIRGINFSTNSNFGDGMLFQVCQNNMLIENCIFNALTLTLQGETSASAQYAQSQNNIVRKNAFYGQYDYAGSHACGMFADGTVLTIEDNVLWHCGWKVGVDRSAAVSAGGPDQYKHCLYIDGHQGNAPSAPLVTIRRNVTIDGSAAGLSLRGNHICHHNVIIDCPTPEFKGGGSASDSESPAGNIQKSYCQLVIGGASISPTQPRWEGFYSRNGASGQAWTRYCLYVNNPGIGLTNNNWLTVGNEIPAQPTYMEFASNRAFGFIPASPDTARLAKTTVSSGSLASIFVTDIDNISVSTSPMTTAQLYAAIGFTNTDPAEQKQDMVNAMIADPTQDWAYNLLAAASPGFGFDFNYTLA